MRTHPVEGILHAALKMSIKAIFRAGCIVKRNKLVQDVPIPGFLDISCHS